MLHWVAIQSSDEIVSMNARNRHPLTVHQHIPTHSGVNRDIIAKGKTTIVHVQSKAEQSKWNPRSIVQMKWKSSSFMSTHACTHTAAILIKMWTCEWKNRRKQTNKRSHSHYDHVSGFIFTYIYICNAHTPTIFRTLLLPFEHNVTEFSKNCILYVYHMWKMKEVQLQHELKEQKIIAHSGSHIRMWKSIKFICHRLFGQKV